MADIYRILNPYSPNPTDLEDTSATTPTDRLGNERGLVAARAGDPIPYVFGHTMVTPRIIAVEFGPDSGGSGSSVYVDYLYSVGECEEFIGLTIGGEFEATPGNYEYYLGTASQVASPNMIASKGAYDTLDGICHIVVELNTPAHSIDHKCEMKGLKLWDPRTSPQAFAYSNNPALCLARIFVDSGYTVNWDTVAESADYCDEDVNGSPRWTFDFPVVNRRSLKQWASMVAAHGSLLVDLHGGEVRLIPNKKVTSSPIIQRSITASNIVDGTAKTTKAGTRQIPKQVIAHFRELDGTVRTATTGSGSAGEISRLQVKGFQTYTMAKRFAIESLNKAKADLRHEHVTHDEGLADSIGDLADITYAPHGLSDKRMRLVGYEEKERARWVRRFVEYDPNLYNDQEHVDPGVTDTDLPNPNSPPTPNEITLTEELFVDETATTYSRLKISFEGSDWPYAQAYKCTCDGEQNVLNVLIAHDGVVTHTAYTAALKQGIEYTAKVWVQSATGALSEVPREATATALGKLLPPGDVPWMNVREVSELISAEWGAAVEIDGDLRGYTLKILPAADHTGTAADWTHANNITLVERHDSQSLLTPSPVGAGTYYVCIKAVDSTGTESTNALCREVVVTTDAWSTNLTNLDVGVVTNMHVYTIDGGYANSAKYAITSTGETWAQRFGDTSPLATWGDAVTQSPAERWGGDLATDSELVTEIWDSSSIKDGAWHFSSAGVTLFGGTQANALLLTDGTMSPWVFTETSGNSTSASARYLKAKVSTTDSPASAGDGLHIKLPIPASFSGAVVPQSGSVTIADDSPLSQPATVTFTTSYTEAPNITLTASGSAALIPVADNVTASSFDIWLFDTDGALIAGTVYWSAEGI
jgi:hypothetical protein